MCPWSECSVDFFPKHNLPPSYSEGGKNMVLMAEERTHVTDLCCIMMYR